MANPRWSAEIHGGGRAIGFNFIQHDRLHVLMEMTKVAISFYSYNLIPMAQPCQDLECDTIKAFRKEL